MNQNPWPTVPSPVTELPELPSATTECMHIINGFFVIPVYLKLTECILKHRNQDIHVLLLTLNEYIVGVHGENQKIKFRENDYKSFFKGMMMMTTMMMIIIIIIHQSKQVVKVR